MAADRSTASQWPGNMWAAQIGLNEPLKIRKRRHKVGLLKEGTSGFWRS